jgi:hypothetical protein
MKTVLNQNAGKFIVLLLAILCAAISHAQINYTFAASAGTYTANTGGTMIIGADKDDSLSTVQNIGFAFTYGCTTYTQFKASSNGFISMGAAASDFKYENTLATTGQGPILAPLWDDLKTNTNGNVNFVLSGSAPNRVLTVEWLNMKWNYQATAASMSFQVKLYETTNVIEFIYRRESTTLNNPTASIGINGGSNATDYYSLNGTGTAPASVYGIEKYDLNSQPASNQLYRFTPGNQVYVSGTVAQASTASISKCEAAQPVIAVQVVASGCNSVISLTQLQFNMTGSTIAGTNTNDVNKIHIYYTGNSPVPVLAAGNEFVSGGINPAAGTITANGSQTLLNGTNYFWIAYDINTPTATNGNVVDAQCTQITVGGVNRVPTVTNPTGTRAIANCTVAPGSTQSNLAFWVKANSGTSSTTNATALTTWNDQSGNGRNATSTVTATSPLYYDNSTNNINFNPVVDFDDAAQAVATADFMDITAGGILSSGNNPYTVYAVIKPGTSNVTRPGKFLFSGVFDAAGNTFNSFDIRSGYAFNDSWDLNDLIIGNKWTPNYPSLATFDFNTAQREMFIAGASSGTKAGNDRNSPDLFNALGCQRAATNKEFFDGSIGEIISYSNTSHSTTTRNKIETYLAIKYGVTLSHNYLSSIGTTIWDRAVNAAYNYNITGIGRDDNSALSQKQSKSTSVVPDILTLYVGPTKQVNQVNNTGTFSSGDRSFFIAANNNDLYMFGGAATEIPAGICCRLRREWLSQKSNFTNTDLKLEFDFNLITPGYIPLNAADLRLLVDNDGDFTNATILGSPAISISVVASVVTVTVSAANFTSTPYFTLASVSANTPLPVRFVQLDANCKNNTAQITWATDAEINMDYYTVERSDDGKNFLAMATVKSKSTATVQQLYNYTDVSPLPGTSYYRLKTTDRSGATGYSTVMTFVDCGTDVVRLTTNTASGESELLLQLSKNEQVDIELFDVLGRRYTMAGVTGKQSMIQETYHLPVTNSNLKSGIYLLSVTINGNKKVYRIIKQ